MKNLSLLLLLFFGLTIQSFAQWDQVYGENYGLRIVKKGNKYGFINSSGKVVIPVEFDLAYSFKNDKYTVVQNNGKQGCIDKSGNMITPLIYTKINSIQSNGLAVVQKDDKQGCIDKSGKVVVPIKYDKVYAFTDGKATVVLNGRKGKTDAYGKVVWGLSVGDYAHGGIVIKLDKSGEHGIICAIEDVGGGKKYKFRDARFASEEYKGYKGWRMPDYDEMKLMYENRKKIGRVSVEKGGRDWDGFSYWTSKDFGNFKYHTIYIVGGEFSGAIREVSEKCNVRAVKEF